MLRRRPDSLMPRPAAAASRDPGEEARAGSVPDGHAGFAVATWNIHSCVGIDARFAPDRIATVIRGLDADIIGLQEVGWHHRGESGIDQFAYLEQATGLKAVAGPTKHDRDAHYGNALLTRFPLLEQSALDLSLPVREPRGGITAVLDVHGTPVRAIVAHLGLDPWERKAQIARILEVVRQTPDLPTLFMGDLNEWRPRAPRLQLLDEHFTDCAAPRSFHARLPTLRLDRIFVSPGLRLVGFDVVRNALTRRASDHLPVRAQLAVKAGQSAG
jgi:endonuclease/exonuclease/phosphatase family metal-dependent hydrolase